MSDVATQEQPGDRLTRFTPAQRAAIRTHDHGLLVSAAAGSGKTATLAERVAHLVCDPATRCDIDQILVVTFTDAAAAEMRHRIEKVLRDRATECGTAHARRQLLLVGRASVGTIHSFCSRLIRQHFERLGVDPRFTLLTDRDATLLRLAAVRGVLDEAHRESEAADSRREGAHPFPSLVEWYGDGDDEQIAKLIIGLHHLGTSVIDPAGWRVAALRRLESAATDPEHSDLGREFAEETRARVEQLLSQCHDAIEAFRSIEVYQNYVREEALPRVEAWRQQIASTGVWSFKLEDSKWKGAPRVGSDVPGKEAAQKLLNDLRDDIKAGPFPAGVPGDPVFWRSSLGACLPHMRELLRLSAAFESAYAAAKASRRVMDFGDLERFGLTLLTGPDGGPSEVARHLHRQYRFVMVDECQDINAVQERILTLASHECLLPRRPSNLFLVGDLKQSIYRFRLAEPELFMMRERKYTGDPAAGQAPQGEVIRLAENFRSRPGVLRIVNGVFERLMIGGRTDIDYATGGHELKPGRAFPDATFTGAPAELHILAPKPRGGQSPSDATEADADDPDQPDDAASTPPDSVAVDELEKLEREAELIARRVHELMGRRPDGTPCPPARVYDKDLDAVRDIRLSDMAVLMRVARVKAQQMASRLRRRGVPVAADVTGGLLQCQEVQDVLAVLQLLDHPGQDVPLAAYLRSPISLLAEPEEAMALARIAHPDLPFHEAVELYARSEATEHSAALADALARVDAWRGLARRRNIADVIERLLDETFLHTYVVGLPDGTQRQANLAELLEAARTYCRGDRSDLGGFTAFLKALEDIDSDLDQPRALGGDADVVRVATVHKSKGLEYAVVFLPDLGTAFREDTDNVFADRDTLLSPRAPDESKRMLYPSPAWAVARARLRPKSIAEELRVLYVAMTRAREHLILIGTADEKNLELARHRWAGHTGPLPEPTVLGARTALEWVLAVEAASHSADPAGRLFETQFHSAEDVQRWESEGDQRFAAAVPDTVKRLGPLPTAAATAARFAVGAGDRAEPAGTSSAETEAAAEDLIRRLAWRYPHAAATARRAAMSVTSLTHPEPGPRGHHPPRPDPAVDVADYTFTEDQPLTDIEPDFDELYANDLGHDDGAGLQAAFEALGSQATSAAPVPSADPDVERVLRELKLPRSLVSNSAELSPTERGTATHLALEHLDFSAGSTSAELLGQLGSMVEAGKLTAREMAAVDVAALRFVIDHPTIGPLLRGEVGTVYRELPIHLAHADTGSTDTPDPIDLQMVRGRIDVLIRTTEGAIVIDYKTDNVWGERLEERVRQYAKQVDLYCNAAEAITGQPCAGVYLVFVHERARVVRRMK